MYFNRMPKGTGHFGEKRYHNTGSANADKQRVMFSIIQTNQNHFLLALSIKSKDVYIINYLGIIA